MFPLAHFTGLPHHAEEAQSIVALWPLILLALELVWLIARRRISLVAGLGMGLVRAAGRRVAPLLVSVTLLAALPLSAAPATNVLRNPSGRVLGYVTVTARGTQELRNADQRFLGSYDAKTNQTRDASSRLVGTGNLLSLLLK